MRTDRYRFVAWKNYRNPESKPIFYELFDHSQDPYETRNIAGDNPELVETLLEQFERVGGVICRLEGLERLATTSRQRNGLGEVSSMLCDPLGALYE